jgi:hypothetical protein
MRRTDNFTEVQGKGKRYGMRNNAEGKCYYCVQPLDPGSKRLCTKHREQFKKSSKEYRKGPGAAEYQSAYMQVYRANKKQSSNN